MVNNFILLTWGSLKVWSYTALWWSTGCCVDTAQRLHIHLWNESLQGHSSFKASFSVKHVMSWVKPTLGEVGEKCNVLTKSREVWWGRWRFHAWGLNPSWTALFLRGTHFVHVKGPVFWRKLVTQATSIFKKRISKPGRSRWILDSKKSKRTKKNAILSAPSTNGFKIKHVKEDLCTGLKEKCQEKGRTLYQKLPKHAREMKYKLREEYRITKDTYEKDKFPQNTAKAPKNKSVVPSLGNHKNGVSLTVLEAFFKQKFTEIDISAATSENGVLKSINCKNGRLLKLHAEEIMSI